MTRMERVPEDDPSLVALATAMVEEMIGLYGGDVGTWKLVPERGQWLVMRDDDGSPVACAGILPLDVAVPGSAAWMGELKRVFVVPAARGRGLSRVVVAAAVDLARELGYRTLWLETGSLQPVAVALYERLGWSRIEPYGPYADHHSICFALDLGRPADDRVVEVAADDPRLLPLHTALLAEMNALYGGTDETAPKPVADGARYLVVVSASGHDVATGAIAPLHWPTAPPRTGEVKRVYVVPSARGRGVGRTLMDALLDLARAASYERLWLETGEPQEGAVALYERSGWRQIEPYGQYADDARTRCYELDL